MDFIHIIEHGFDFFIRRTAILSVHPHTSDSKASTRMVSENDSYVFDGISHVQFMAKYLSDTKS